MILLILVVTVAFAEQENITRRWMTSVEELLTMLSISQLKDEITPTYIGKRTMELSFQSQAGRFRSRVARSLIECTGNKATTCIDPTMTGDDAVQLVHDELIKHGFSVNWLKSSPLCPMIGGRGAAALAVDVPYPEQPKE